MGIVVIELLLFCSAWFCLKAFHLIAEDKCRPQPQLRRSGSRF
jgi:hypothetical protein